MEVKPQILKIFLQINVNINVRCPTASVSFFHVWLIFDELICMLK